MERDLNHLLFKRNVLHKGDDRKKPLFRFQNELAEAIVKMPGPYQKKAVKNLRPYLNQALKSGGADYEKPMSENLKNQIVKIIKARMSEDDPLYVNLEEEFARAYKELKSNATKKPISPDKDYHDFIRWGLKANKVVVLINQPGEMFWSPNRETKDDIDNLINTIYESVFRNFHGSEQENIRKLIHQNERIEYGPFQGMARFQYHIYVPSYSVALTFWQKLFQFFIQEKLPKESYDLETELRISLGCEFLNILNGLDTHDRVKNRPAKSDCIRVFKIDAYLTTVPIVYFISHETTEHGKEEASEVLFALKLANGIMENVFEISGEGFKNWKENVYNVLLTENAARFGVQEVKFDSIKSDLIYITEIPD